MTLRPLPLLWLVAVWVALWEDLSVANVTSGLVVGALLLRFFPVRQRVGGRAHVRPVAVLRLLAHFVVMLLKANLEVAWEVVTPSNERVREGIVAVPLATSSDAVTAMVSSMYSLTPGSLTVEIEHEPLVLYVHVLHLSSVEAVRADLRQLERMVLRAFVSDDAVAAAERRLAEIEAVEATAGGGQG